MPNRQRGFGMALATGRAGLRQSSHADGSRFRQNF